MTQSNERGGERLREELFHILVTQGQDQAGIAMGRRSADGSLYKSRTDEHLERIMQLILADRKQHELDARIDNLETILMLNPHAGSLQVDSYDESDSGDAYVFITLAEKLTELKAEREALDGTK